MQQEGQARVAQPHGVLEIVGDLERGDALPELVAVEGQGRLEAERDGRLVWSTLEPADFAERGTAMVRHLDALRPYVLFPHPVGTAPTTSWEASR